MAKFKFLILSTMIGIFLITAADSSFASSYYLYHSWGGTWHDADKTSNNNDDNFMCWAAAAANVLAWTGWGFPPKTNYQNEDDIFRDFQDHWTDNGGWMDYAWNWWFDGTPPPPNKSPSIVNIPGGGNYWPDYPFVDYFHQWSASEMSDGSGAMDAIGDFLRSGYGVTLTAYIDQEDVQGAHAITVWGYEYDENENYLGIYITDSDDDSSSDNPPDSLDFVKVAMNQDDGIWYWYLQDYYQPDWNWKIKEVQALEQAPVPLPASMLLMCSGLATLAVFRRKIKK